MATDQAIPIINEPWIGGKLRAVHDRYTKKLDHYAIEDSAGVLWSGGPVEVEIKKLITASSTPIQAR